MDMANREPIEIVEIDVDYCNNTYGTAPCTAVLGTDGVRKCFNTFATCQDTVNFIKGTKTLRFTNNRANLPKGYKSYPCLEDGGVSAFSSTVNIAGTSENSGAMGKRATVSAKLFDFPDDDIDFDKYVAGRISGTAQTDEGGYSPLTRGSFFSKLKSRFPHYTGRPMRVITGYVDDGVMTISSTRNYIITDIAGPDNDGSVVISGKDVLALADDKKALCPKPSRGKLTAGVTAAVSQTATLIPSGIGAEYNTATTYGVIGEEIVTFTRVGDVVTLTARGQLGTVAAAHNANDTLQQCYHFNNVSTDTVLTVLLQTFAGIDPSFLDTANWAIEITKWLSYLQIQTVITKPTGVTQLIGELSSLGLSVWWDSEAQLVKMLANHPVTTFYDISDNNNIIDIEQQDDDENRLTQVHFYHKQTTPIKSYNDKANYNQINVIIDTNAESVNAYDDTRTKEIFCRFLNQGADSVVSTLGQRLLKRFNTAPVKYEITLNIDDNYIGLGDIINLDSRVVTDATGKNKPTLVQVSRKTHSKAGHEIKLLCQAFQYEGRYGGVMVNGSPVYASATPTQKLVGCYAVNGTTLKFSDGTGPYILI